MFLKYAKEKHIKELKKQDINVFWTYLPFSIILYAHKEWAAKFEITEYPKWYKPLPGKEINILIFVDELEFIIKGIFEGEY